MQKLLFLLLVLMLSGSNSLAMDFGWGSLKMVFPIVDSEGRDMRFNKKRQKSCRRIFQNPYQVHMTQITIGDQGPLASMTLESARVNLENAGRQETDIVATNKPLQIHKDLFDQSMAQWIEHGYGPHQVGLLRDINNQLPPHRVQWYQFRFSEELIGSFPGGIKPEYQGLSSIRIFDGSSHPKILGFAKNLDMPVERGGMAVRDPIELSPKNQRAGYDLPWKTHSEGEPYYYWHLGIGTNQKNFEGGLHIMFSRVAEQIDHFYNRSNYKTFGQVEAVEALNMKIISSSKPELVEYYKKFGFEVLDPQTGQVADSVIQVNSKGVGEIVDGYPLLPDGMVLISQNAGAFLKRFSDSSMTPEIKYENEYGSFHLHKGQKNPNDPEVLFRNGNIKAYGRVETYETKVDLLQRIQQVEALHANYAIALKQFVDSHPQVYRMDRPEVDMFKSHQQWKALVKTYRQFAMHFYVLVNNIPPKWRNQEWTAMDMLATSLLTDFPLEAWNNLTPNTSKTRLEVFEGLEFMAR